MCDGACDCHFFNAARENAESRNDPLEKGLGVKVIYLGGVAISNRNERRFEPILAQTLEHGCKRPSDFDSLRALLGGTSEVSV